jgi:hypothetical protein
MIAGRKMKHVGRKRRQLVACIATYALVLHTILVAFALPAAAIAVPGDGVPQFTLCLHDSGGTAPAVPTDQADEHCKLCIGCAHSAAAALPRSPQPLPVAYEIKLRWAVTRDVLTVPPAFFSVRSRGPPFSA